MVFIRSAERLYSNKTRVARPCTRDLDGEPESGVLLTREARNNGRAAAVCIRPGWYKPAGDVTMGRCECRDYKPDKEKGPASGTVFASFTLFDLERARTRRAIIVSPNVPARALRLFSFT